jgi:adenine-specific DNA-methyltransferase
VAVSDLAPMEKRCEQSTMKSLARNVIPFMTKLPYTIECADNIDFMRSLKKESMNLIVTSPPYNIGKEYEHRTSLDVYI